MKMEFDSGVGERSSRIFDNLPDAILFFNPAGDLKYINNAGLTLMGQDTRHRHFCEIADCGTSSFPELIDNVRRRVIVDQVACNKKPLKNGRPLYLNIIPIGGGAICTLTDRKIVSAGNESMYRAIYCGSMDAIFIVDPADHHILSVNSAAEGLTGYRYPELIGREYETVVTKPDQERARRLFGRATADRTRTEYVDLYRKDGTMVPA
jgi:PAS domain S-box-containing protein